MAKRRQIETRFWKDSRVKTLNSNEKYLYMYLLTNSFTNIVGVYEIDLGEISLDTGLQQWIIEDILKKFEEEGKIIYKKAWIYMKNFTKYQSKAETVVKGMWKELEGVPNWLKDEIKLDIPDIKYNKTYTKKYAKKKSEALRYVVDTTPKAPVDKDKALETLRKSKDKIGKK